MTGHPAFPAEPWCLRETELHFRLLAQSESLFALSNGHLSWRGNLDEGEPHGLPGTYLNGFHEQRPLPYAEAGYGFPESGDTIINVTNGKLLRLLVGDEPFDVRYGELRSHERVLDFRAGTLQRTAEWVSPAGQAIRLTSTRLVSLTQRAIAAVSYAVEPVGGPADLVIQSELVANEQLPPAGRSKDPRAASVLQAPLLSQSHATRGDAAMLIHRTRHSKLLLATAMRHLVAGPAECRQAHETAPDLARLTVAAHLEPSQRLELVKFAGYGWSGTRSVSALGDQVDAALTAAVRADWDGLLAQQRDYLTSFWERADVELDGDPEVQQAIRFGQFHVLQAAARAEGQAIPAKGLTGPGYDGHAFWDTEMFVLPLLTVTHPEAAANALRWRHATLGQATTRAWQLGLAGAAFPWRTITGTDCSGYWPAGTAAFHVNAGIADAVTRHVRSTGDTGFEAEPGLELLVQTARLWLSVGHYDEHGKFRIDGVTGPEEYSALADNNLYTNLMAQQNLRSAADAADRHPDQARALSAGEDERLGWRQLRPGVMPLQRACGGRERPSSRTRCP
jgi:alpha,alpha-trehalose phosphorylase